MCCVSQNNSFWQYKAEQVKTWHPEHKEKPADFFRKRLLDCRAQQSCFTKAASVPSDDQLASYKVVYRAAQCEKLHTIVEESIIIFRYWFGFNYDWWSNSQQTKGWSTVRQYPAEKVWEPLHISYWPIHFSVEYLSLFFIHQGHISSHYIIMHVKAVRGFVLCLGEGWDWSMCLCQEANLQWHLMTEAEGWTPVIHTSSESGGWNSQLTGCKRKEQSSSVNLNINMYVTFAFC